MVWDAEKPSLEVENYQIAQSFADASLAYNNNPTALHLRAMKMLFEGLKEKGAPVIVSSRGVETMNLGGLAGLTSLAGISSEALASDQGIDEV